MEIHDVNELRKRLAITMNELMVSKQAINWIDSATHKLITIPYIEIIFKYATLVQFIDWMKF